MVEASKLKGRSSRMPAPPTPEEAGTNLKAPEVAPAEPARLRRDGRTLRATGRTHAFGTRIKLSTHEDMLDIVEREGITLGELIEKAIEAYKRG